jgi:hypothetical protein
MIVVEIITNRPLARQTIDNARTQRYVAIRGRARASACRIGSMTPFPPSANRSRPPLFDFSDTLIPSIGRT